MYRLTFAKLIAADKRQVFLVALEALLGCFLVLVIINEAYIKNWNAGICGKYIFTSVGVNT